MGHLTIRKGTKESAAQSEIVVDKLEIRDFVSSPISTAGLAALCFALLSVGKF